MHSALYMPAERYAFAVGSLTAIMRMRIRDVEERRDMIHACMRTVGIDTGAWFIADGRTHPEHYGELLEALLAVEPSPFSGEIDPCAVKFVLGEVGDVWPDWLMAEDHDGNRPRLSA